MNAEFLSELDLLLGHTIGSLKRLQAELRRLAADGAVTYPVAIEHWQLAGAELTDTGLSYAELDAALRRESGSLP